VHAFEKQFEQVITLLVTASQDVLSQRLLSRNREDAADIEQRLIRGRRAVHARHLLTLDNSGSFAEALSRFITTLESVARPDQKHSLAVSL